MVQGANMVSTKGDETPHPRSLLSVLIGDVIDICYFLTPLVISYHVGWFVNYRFRI